jgi:plastocyanin
MNTGMLRAVGCALLAFSLSPAHGAGIHGTVVVKRRLTKRKVTLQAEDYQRGTAVGLESDSGSDALAFEKSHVAIYLEGVQPAKTGVPRPPLTTPPLTMEQKNRTFVPDLLVIPAGSAVSFPNVDPIFHNVFSLSRPKSFDLGNYPAHQTRVVTFDKPGIVTVNCHLHPNMSAAIVISPNAWAARADGEGRFTLPEVPPGRYTVVAWHKAAGFFRREIQLTADRDAEVEFLIPLEAAAPEPVHLSAHSGHPAEAR